RVTALPAYSTSTQTLRLRPALPRTSPIAFLCLLACRLGEKILPSRKSLSEFKRRSNMSVTDEVLKANEAYAQTFNLGNLSLPPARKLAVVACMDARLIVSRILGLKAGDAHIIRNAGGIVTEDALRSLIISHELLGTQEFIII